MKTENYLSLREDFSASPYGRRCSTSNVNHDVAREIDRRGISQRVARHVIADWLVDVRLGQSRPRHAALSLEEH